MNIRISTLALALAVGVAFASDSRIEQGKAFAAQGEYDKALAEYSAVLAEQPRNAEAYYATAEVRMKQKDYSRAIANYRLAYRFLPTMSAAYEGAARVYETLGQKDKADAERARDPKNKPVEEAPKESASVVHPVETAVSLSSASSAPVSKVSTAPENSEIASISKSEPPTSSASVALEKTSPSAIAAAAPASSASVSAEKNAPSVAASSASATSSTTKEVAAQTPSASESVPEKKPTSSAAEAPTVPSSDSTTSEDPFEKGKSLFAEGKFKEAAPLWSEVLKKYPGHAGAYFYAGVTRYELGEMNRAEINLKKGLAYKEEGNDANFYLACVYQKTNRTELEKKALTAYLKKAAPDAKFREQAEGRLAELTTPLEPAATNEVVADTVKADSVAEQPSENAVAVDSASAEGSFVAEANKLLKSGDLEGALQMYRSLLAKEISVDERCFVILQMGNIYREMRDFHSAETRYREVVQQFPDSDWSIEAERALNDAIWLQKHADELPRRVR